MAVAVKSTEELTEQKKPLIRKRRVVVTGTSVVTLLGHDSDVFGEHVMFDKSILCFDIEHVFYDAIEALRFSCKKVNPFCVPFTTTNMDSAMLAMDLGWMVPNYSTSTACAISSFCTLNSANHIIKANAIRPYALGIAPILCKCYFLVLLKLHNRDGFVMAEGAGVLPLEELEHAKDHIVRTL
ncbi:3-oxoacyl-[acyl-carrier-protein] synthase II, chloroplastic-like [Malus sylvestris]|uniref:3-oxoacyl-[acyl-carrier-protein] synthase II, chloroplastic-like n=1 Tax=Malus sylvestris TaxID=3752 RepID=UPI0021ABB390|nr:3-oxoacyl-[acyl-carrier-protein] synthase II, chloroplastic-like [Malus sylvestris]